MKVLFLTHWYPSPQDPSHGVFVREHAYAIAAAQVDLHVVHVRIVPGGYGISSTVEEVSEGPFRCTRLVITSPLCRLLYIYYPWQWRIIRRAMVKAGIDPAGYDLVHSSVVHPSGVIGSRLAAWGGVPHVISEHWTRLTHYFQHGFLRTEGLEAYRSAALVMPVSKNLGTVVKRFAGTRVRVEVVPNVVPGEWFKFMPKVNGEEIRLVLIARWDKTKVPHKRPDLAIDAVAALQAELDRPVRLVFIGGGNRIAELEKRAAQMDVRAVFLRQCSKERVAAELSQADLLLHPTERETFAVVVAEALKCGVPVVASNVGAVSELVGPGNGVLVANTVDEWKHGLRLALTTRFDRRGIAEAWAERFTYAEIGGLIAILYRQVLARRGR